MPQSAHRPVRHLQVEVRAERVLVYRTKLG
jgi:hypothetical protein